MVSWIWMVPAAIFGSLILFPLWWLGACWFVYSKVDPFYKPLRHRIRAFLGET